MFKRSATQRTQKRKNERELRQLYSIRLDQVMAVLLKHVCSVNLFHGYSAQSMHKDKARINEHKHFWINEILSKWYLQRTHWFRLLNTQPGPVFRSSWASRPTVIFTCSRAGRQLCICPRRCSWSSKDQWRWSWTGGREPRWPSWSLRPRERSLSPPARDPCNNTGRGKDEQPVKTEGLPLLQQGYTEAL